jgi:hypothetical protein
MTKQIIIQITIDGLEDWDVDWENPHEVSQTLTELESDFKSGICRNHGISYNNIVISSKFEDGDI